MKIFPFHYEVRPRTVFGIKISKIIYTPSPCLKENSAQTKNAQMKSMIHIVASLHTNEGFTMQTRVKSALTKYLGGVLKLRTNEKCTNENRTNQGLGVCRLLLK